MRAQGTSLADAQELVNISQIGGVVQVDRALGAGFKFVASARLDNHSIFGNMFAPKGALLWNGLGGTFRVTYGRAFAAPLILFQFANVFNTVFGNGEGVTYTSNNQTFVTEKLKPEEIGTWEIGYKGLIAKKLYVDLNGWYANSKNFLSPAITVLGTAQKVGSRPVNPAIPSLFLTYFNYGNVVSYGMDFGLNYELNKYVNVGLKYSYFGSDITDGKIENDANKDGYVSAEEKSLNAPQNRLVFNVAMDKLFNNKFFANVTVRWVEQFDFYSGSQIGTAAGAGKRGVVSVAAGTNPTTGAPRATAILKNFDHGALGGFTSIDISLGYKIKPWVSLGASVSNLFEAKQREFVGSPVIGRLISAELRFDIPAFGKK